MTAELNVAEQRGAICLECLARVRQFNGQPGSERFCTHCSSELFDVETAGEDVAEGQRTPEPRS